MSQAPTLSVVIPSFNAANVITRQLDRLTSQNRELALGLDSAPIEVIVSDNGSVDDTAGVVARYSNTLPVRWVDASARRGPAAARNIGASHALGRVLVFTDADDLIGDGWLAAWWRWANAVGDRAFGAGPIVHSAGGEPGPSDRARPIPHQMNLPCASGNNFGCTAALFFELGGFDENRWTGEDIDLSWRAVASDVDIDEVPAVVGVAHDRSGFALLRRYFEYGLGDPALFRDHRSIGAKRSPWKSTVRTYVGLLVRVPVLWSARQRDRWLRQVGRRAGRLIGSVRCRTWFP